MITDFKNTNNNWVYQSNKLIESSFALTVIEQKLIRLLASMVKKNDDDFKEYEFRTKDLIKILNTSDSRFYRDIDNVTDSLMQRIIKIKDVNSGEFEKYHWVDVCKYKDGILKLKINKEMKPFYLSLDWYTKYQLKNIMQFKSTYSFRLYELLKQYESIGNRVINVSDLMIILDIGKGQYAQYSNLKQKVINVAMKEININTDLCIEYEEIKTVRKVTAIKFYIKQNKSKSEIAITSAAPEESQELQQQSITDMININSVKSIINEKISDVEAIKIFNAAEGNLDKVKEKYTIVIQMNKVNNFVGAMIKALKENWTTVGKSKEGTFNDYEQRSYDFEELEKRLLGWD